MFIKEENFAVTELSNGVLRKIKGCINDLMVVELTWKAGMEGAPHAHPHRQCGYIISGRYEVIAGDEKQVLSAGEAFYTEAGEVHGMRCLEDGVTLDVFTPYREDFVS